jgi:hypothetical protein
VFHLSREQALSDARKWQNGGCNAPFRAAFTVSNFSPLMPQQPTMTGQIQKHKKGLAKIRGDAP